MKNSPRDYSTAQTYTPGYARAKQAMVFVGVLLFLAGVSQLWIPLRLLAFGVHTRAEVVRIIKEKPGQSPVVISDPVQLQRQLEPRDRSYVFWNEFRFYTANGNAVDVRSNIGSQLKPLYPLSDADGLPATDLICYNPADPHEVSFPLIISTWLPAAVLTLAGLAIVIIGSFLLHWANKPIELPQLPPSTTVA